ncbi:helix-turn-helix domain-containing protein (plasmid) [Ihubacter sp. rT4E-8]
MPPWTFAQLYAAGASMEQIMADMQIGRRTYYRYKAAYEGSDNN